MKIPPSACPECRRLIEAYQAAVDAFSEFLGGVEREEVKKRIREARIALAGHMKQDANPPHSRPAA